MLSMVSDLLWCYVFDCTSGLIVLICEPHVLLLMYHPVGCQVDIVSSSSGISSSSSCFSDRPELTIRYDTIDELHWKTDRQAASLI